MTKTLEIIFGERLWLADARGILFEPEQRQLLVADLHLEKARALRHDGHPLPPQDTIDTLERLAALIREYRAQTVICLGDSFHSVAMAQTLFPPTIDTINALVGSVKQWIWVQGNHDPLLPRSLHGSRQEFYGVGKVKCLHEPEKYTEKSEHRYQIFGHFHPKARVQLKTQKTGGRCFVHNHYHLLMPAFGSFTGGLDINDDAIQQWIPAEARTVYLIKQKKIWSLNPKWV